jgi:thiamine-phosphate pyrophosphorylase
MTASAPEITTGRLYLVTPQRFDPETLAEVIGRMLATGAVSCVRLDLGGAPEPEWIRASNHLQPVCHDHDVPLLVADHFRLVPALGLDGVHLSDTRVAFKTVRKELGADCIIGGTGGVQRHTGMTLAEAGADYVTLGPVRAAGALGDGAVAEDALFEWWAEVIETPVVAEGGVLPEDVARLLPVSDFFVPDRALWTSPDPVAALAAYAAALAE